MTLKEFGKKLREIYTFASYGEFWITADSSTIAMWIIEPVFDKEREEWRCYVPAPSYMGYFLYNPSLTDFVDLTEYGVTGEDSDFSKCKEKIE